MPKKHFLTRIFKIIFLPALLIFIFILAFPQIAQAELVPYSYSTADDFVIRVEPFLKDYYTIFTNPDYTGYNYDINCNDEEDNTFEATGVHGDYTCDYSAYSTTVPHDIRIRSHTKDGRGFPTFINNSDNCLYDLLAVLQWGNMKWESFDSAFMGCQRMQSDQFPSGVGVPDLSRVYSMHSAFEDSNYPDDNLSNWDVSNIVRRQSFRTVSNGDFSPLWLDYTPALCRCCWRRKASVCSLSLLRFLMISLSLPT